MESRERHAEPFSEDEEFVDMAGFKQSLCWVSNLLLWVVQGRVYIRGGKEDARVSRSRASGSASLEVEARTTKSFDLCPVLFRLFDASLRVDSLV
jgi:hypothetical protein